MKALPGTIDYRNVEERRKSFQNSSSAILKRKAEDLAKAGFIYCGVKDYVQCVYCNLRLRKWDAKDKPLAEHKIWKPSCPYILSKTKQIQRSMVRVCSDQTNGADYTDSSVRQRTFTRANICVSVQTMAEAGFYLYKDGTDHVRCFSCGIQLVNWKTGEDPWMEHARASAECQHVKRCKGTQFIERARLKNIQKKEEETDEVIDASLQEDGVKAVLDAVTLLDDDQSKEIELEVKASPDDERALRQEENEQLNERMKCRICKEKEVKVVFLPCGHLCSCAQCAPALRTCPVCSNKVSGTLGVSIVG
ncbi:hypothetical protein FSP39_025415 [Pinctada imbricata]|uniref:RING-type domain-containing protein n=1 Tax=Pinctada imbricata TaxID=66713 RepID=A0AA89C2V4_PINIB|nr:hypothetical protein FSP39_025415 [Pinctada imbricata]